MRHQKRGRKLSRTASHRRALFRNLVTSFLKYESITTTLAKAKELRRYAEKIITLGKRGDLHARRLALSFIQEKDVVKSLFEDIAPRFVERKGGYTRILKLGRRPGDGAEMAMIQLVQMSEERAKQLITVKIKQKDVDKTKKGPEPKTEDKPEDVK